ncbi:DsbA family oxidoreductase [Ornithinibacillus scapharcae]|uniref:DsbA family oxidoreductase n=1 Tax=Ornithinibacillus scapharcae TaxID=1147159 RepID=UPI000225BAB5|nr:DsbA family oxidoreductase [Ornithinibacillus scapharcae]
MKIEVWSDFVCPFCYIGKRRLEAALEQFAYRDQVAVEYKSFELDPNAKVYQGITIHEAIANKYGISLEEARKANDGIGSQAQTVGLVFDFENMKPTNTFDAHRLTKYAESVGKGKQLTEKLLHAYFVEGQLLSDHDILLSIATTVGVDSEKTKEVLSNSDLYANDVRDEEMRAHQYGASGVPFFVINEKYAISGAQPTELFVSALQQVWEEVAPRPKLEQLGANSGTVCTDDGCIIPDTK